MTDAYYQSRYTPNTDRGIVWPEIVRFLSPYLKGKQIVLDMGAGYCDFINNVSSPHRIAVDISPDSKGFAAHGVQTITAALPKEVADGSVDVVFASNLFEHLDDSELTAMMNEVRRILKPEGLLILMQPNYRLSYKTYFDDPTHKKVFSDAAMTSFLLSHYFSIVRSWRRFLPFSLKSRPGIIPVAGWLVRLYMHSPWKPFAGQMLFVAKKS